MVRRRARSGIKSILREKPLERHPVKLQALPALHDKCIWVVHDDAGRALVVDPGDAAPVVAAAALGLQPVAILLTHHHGDHVGGAWALRERWPGIEVFATADDRIGIDCERL